MSIARLIIKPSYMHMYVMYMHLYIMYMHMYMCMYCLPRNTQLVLLTSFSYLYKAVCIHVQK